MAGALAWPAAARAQGTSQPRTPPPAGPAKARIGIVTGLPETDPATQARLEAFRDGMDERGWTEGHNLVLDIRYEAGDDQRAQRLVGELLTHEPNVLLTQGLPAAAAARDATAISPGTPSVVFVAVPDPVGAGLIRSLARPGGNLTGLASDGPGLGARWVALLKEIAPPVQRVLVLAHRRTPFDKAGIEAAAKRLGLAVTYAQVEAEAAVASAIDAFAGTPGGGLLLPTDAFISSCRATIIARTRKYKLPLMAGNPPFVPDGGLVYYGADVVDLYRRAAHYADSLLRGASPADLPVRQPDHFQTVINLQTALSLGLNPSPDLLARADEIYR